jgi:hypothetical protein
MPCPLSRRRARRELGGTAGPADAQRVGRRKEARRWDARWRFAVAEGPRATLGDPSVSPNEFRRLQRVPALEDSLHAGAALDTDR